MLGAIASDCVTPSAAKDTQIDRHRIKILQHMKPTATVRELSPHDDMTLLTELIHAAYAKRAARNLRYWATHQTVADTVKRLGSGHGMIAEIAGEIVGTLTVRPPQASSEVPIYRIPNTWTLSHFAVLNLPLFDVPLSHFIMLPSIAVPRPSVSQIASD
jgi:hypothetical protein